MKNASVGIVGEEITLIESSLTFKHDDSKWDSIVDLKEAHLYPGIVAPNSTLGLTEIDAVRATRDYDDVGELNPHVRSLIAFNAESDVMTTIKTNGVLLVQSVPRGGTVSGQSSVFHTQGWNWEDAAVSVDDGVHLNWPRFLRYWNAGLQKNKVDDSKDAYAKEKKEIEDFFDLTLAYFNSDAVQIDNRLEGMRGIFSGNKRLYIHADELQQLTDVLLFCNKYKIAHPVIVGGYDAHLLLPQLRDAKIPVMLPRVHSLPYNENDAIDHAFQLPGILHEAGILYCLQNEGDMEAMNSRNIPFLAGHTMGFGLSEEEALMSVTLNPCRIMGIDSEYGSIEIGKKATLFVSEGPALNMRTNHVTHALMNGEWVDLSNRQESLYLKYKKKYEQQN